MREITYAEARLKAAAFKEIGDTSIYLFKGEMPWHFAMSCEPGGTHRLEMATSVNFSGTDPETGLTFRWSFDIEPRSANGKGSYEIDASACRDVLAMLKGECKQKFQLYLMDCAQKVKAKADEWQALVDRQNRDALILRGLANEC